jgi:hypothetical protein
VSSRDPESVAVGWRKRKLLGSNRAGVNYPFYEEVGNKDIKIKNTVSYLENYTVHILALLISK